MSNAQKQIAHIRQLCCLGLSSEAIMPDLMKALGRVMDCHSGVFMWFDGKGQIRNIFVDIFLPQVVNLYVTEYENLKNPYGPDLPAVAQKGKTLGNYRVMPQGFYKTDMYNLICRPYDQHYMLDAIIKDNETALGALMLYREKGHRQFTRAEQARLAQLVPYIQHAILSDNSVIGDERPLEDFTAVSRGIILADLSGRISHIDDKAREALFWTEEANFSQGGDLLAQMDTTLKSLVDRLCRNMDRIRRSENAAAPSIRLKHHCGELHLNATLLQAYQPGLQDLVSIAITLKRHKPLAIMSRLENLPLSPKQKELSLLVGMGHSAGEIAEKLNISQNTYKEYLQAIYAKLSINRKEDFYTLLTR
jgi:DNA-binding CsgD family transcriptional regulator